LAVYRWFGTNFKKMGVTFPTHSDDGDSGSGKPSGGSTAGGGGGGAGGGGGGGGGGGADTDADADADAEAAEASARFFAFDESARETIKAAVICSLAYTYQVGAFKHKHPSRDIYCGGKDKATLPCVARATLLCVAKATLLCVTKVTLLFVARQRFCLWQCNDVVCGKATLLCVARQHCHHNKYRH
jgi:hypothetical protein